MIIKIGTRRIVIEYNCFFLKKKTNMNGCAKECLLKLKQKKQVFENKLKL